MENMKGAVQLLSELCGEGQPLSSVRMGKIEFEASPDNKTVDIISRFIKELTQHGWVVVDGVVQDAGETTLGHDGTKRAVLGITINIVRPTDTPV